MTQPLYGVYGTGGCGRGIMPLARREIVNLGVGFDRLVFIDDARVAAHINGHPVLTYRQFLEIKATKRFATLAIASGVAREMLAAKCAADNIQPWSVSADSVVIMDDVIIGEGAILSPFVTLTSNIRIGRHFQANL